MEGGVGREDSISEIVATLRRRPADAYLPIRRNNETTLPSVNSFGRKQVLHAFDKLMPARHGPSRQQQPMMCTRLITPDVGEVQVLRDEKAGGILGRLPYLRIGSAREALMRSSVNVVPHRS